jgi:hypothetical protein
MTGLLPRLTAGAWSTAWLEGSGVTFRLTWCGREFELMLAGSVRKQRA